MSYHFWAQWSHVGSLKSPIVGVVIPWISSSYTVGIPSLQTSTFHIKRYSVSLIVKEMQIKTTMRYPLTPVRMAIINKSTNNKCWWGCGERETFLHCWWECRLVQPQWEATWSYLKKLKMDLPYDPAILLLGIYQKKPKTITQRIYALLCSCLLYTSDAADDWLVV